MRCCPAGWSADWTHLEHTLRNMGLSSVHSCDSPRLPPVGTAHCSVILRGKLVFTPAPPHSSAACGTILSSLCCCSLTLEFMNHNPSRQWKVTTPAAQVTSPWCYPSSPPLLLFHTINQKIEFISRHSPEQGNATFSFSKHNVS